MRKGIDEILRNRRQFFEKLGREYGVYGKIYLVDGDEATNVLYDSILFLEDTTFTKITDYEMLSYPVSTGTCVLASDAGGDTITRTNGKLFTPIIIGDKIPLIDSDEDENDGVINDVTDSETVETTATLGLKDGTCTYTIEVKNMYPGATFKAGMVIFGLFDNIEIDTGKCICYKSREY